jgi:predicted ferric reductase
LAVDASLDQIIASTRPRLVRPRRGPGFLAAPANDSRTAPDAPVPGQAGRRAVTLVAAGSLAVVVLLWTANGGLTALTHAVDGLTSLGRLTGLLSADLLLLQVLAMSRIPAVERAFGQDGLVRGHRMLGVGSVTLLAAHVVLVTLGYAADSRNHVAVIAWRMLTTYPGMLLATAATVLVFLVAVSSVRRVRSRLRYESWHLLHLYAYLGVGLAVPHELWNGTEFLSSRLAAGYWVGLYGTAAGSLLAFRVGLPLWRSVRYGLRVAAVVPETADTVSVHITGRALDRFPAAAGQFLHWRFLSGPHRAQAHPYSLSAAPGRRGLRITVREVGDASRSLRTLRPGTRVIVEGPYGRLTAAVRTRRRVALLASGIGITPLRALLEELDYLPGDAMLIYRVRAPSEIVFRAELRELSDRRGAQVFYVIGSRVPGRSSWLPSSAARRSDARALLEAVPDAPDRDLYICGPDAWTAAVVEAARAAGVPTRQLHHESFTL